MPTSEQVRRAVDTYIEAFEKGDREAWLANFAEDAFHVDPPTAPPNIGRAAIGTFWDNTRQLAERFEFLVEDVIIVDDEAVLVFTMRAHAGGGALDLHIVDVFTIDDDGRIARQKAYFDMSTIRPAGD